jgi:hypothetical protein
MLRAEPSVDCRPLVPLQKISVTQFCDVCFVPSPKSPILTLDSPSTLDIRTFAGFKSALLSEWR